jgi:hypothetical protein
METQQETGTVELGGAGMKARFVGIHTPTILIGLMIVLCLLVVGYIEQDSRKWDESAKRDYLDQHKVTQSILNNVVTNQQAIMQLIKDSQRMTTEGTNEISYMLSLDQAARERLRLQMPATLREKVRDRQ